MQRLLDLPWELWFVFFGSYTILLIYGWPHACREVFAIRRDLQSGVSLTDILTRSFRRTSEWIRLNPAAQINISLFVLAVALLVYSYYDLLQKTVVLSNSS